MTQNGKAKVTRIVGLGRRKATVLEHESLRVKLDDEGGMIPELSAIQGKKQINAHWLPWFRGNSGKPYNAAEHEDFWKAGILYNLAGNFPCLPSFGAGHVLDGIDMPSHGWTANYPWEFKNSGIDEESGAAWAVSVMESPETSMPLSFIKIDAVIPGHGVHYASILVKNRGSDPIEISAAYHNTIGAPFLSEGCRLTACGDAWLTPPRGTEFDTTTRFALEKEFASLREAPLSDGGKADLTLVPRPIGYTDFATGRVPSSSSLGWSSVVNPSAGLAYICFFTGPAAAAEDDVILRFNELWMQYGGRNYTPWAAYEGGTDLTYCLGTENALSAGANGLDYSRKNKELLGSPTVAAIPAGGSKSLRYGTAFAPCAASLYEGIDAVEGEENALLCKGKGGVFKISADPAFGCLKKLEKIEPVLKLG